MISYDLEKRCGSVFLLCDELNMGMISLITISILYNLIL